VVIPTRNRPDRIPSAVGSVLENDPGPFEVIVVDQSDDESTRTALESFRARAQLRYLKTPPRGSANARNLGISQARGNVIALTDDDCVVPGNWVSELNRAFEADSRVAVVFGNVLAAPHDSAAGFIPAYLRRDAATARTANESHRVDGMSACMALRPSAWQALGGFDEMLGAGAPLRSAAEGDFGLRALEAGYALRHSPQWTVVHHGFRRWPDGRALIHDYWYGTGAVVAKPLKSGDWSAWRFASHLAWRWAFGRSPVAASLGVSAHRWLRLTAFLKGLAAGALTPVDRATGHYTPDGDRGDQAAAGHQVPITGSPSD
jgi:glycosyltransferase involved in cell wall biosynthesis